MAQWNKQDQAYRVQDTTNFEVVMIADEDGNPINSFGAASNIPLLADRLKDTITFISLVLIQI
jgi:hypothetical protein